MWKALLLCALVALCAAEQHRGAWRQNMQYRYKVHTQTLAAMPNLKNQWVGLFTKADLTIRPRSENILVGKLHNGEYSEFHDSLPEGPTHYQPGNDLTYRPMEMNTKEFEIRLNNGAVHSIAVDEEMTNVELNQLKSIISQLQVDIQARNVIKTPRSHLPVKSDSKDNDNQALYKVMEPTVTGKCETVYDISRIPSYLAQVYPENTDDLPLRKNESVYEVIKSKNYANCEQRMGYHFGVSGFDEWKPNTNSMGSLSKSAVSRVIITGDFDAFTIRSSVTTNRVVKANSDTENQHDSMIVSQVNVTLASMEENHGKAHTKSEQLIDVGNLVYTFDIASDSKNALRPKKDSSESQEDDGEDEGWNTFQKTSDMAESHHQQRKPEKKSRSVRSVHMEDLWKTVSGENDSDDSDREYLQPKPTMENAPENPMLNYFVGNKGSSIQNAKNFNAPAEVEKLAREVADDLEDPNEVPVKQTLRKFNVLSKVIRTMNAKQIEEATRSLTMEQDEQDQDKKTEKARNVYRDALASAGTGPAVNEVMKWIENGKLTGEAAVQVISSFPKNIREPTEEMQKRFFDFVKNDAVKQQEYVNTTAGIAFTRFMFQAQINNKSANNFYPVETFGRLADRDSEFVSQKVIPYFANLLKKAVNEDDAPHTLYAIRALGNLGHADVPRVFEPYFKGDKRVTNFQRLAMVLAMDKFINNYKTEARVVLFNIYQNKAEASEIRSAAVFQLMRTNPSEDILQRMAEETNNEESNDVRAAVSSAIESASRLTHPKHTKLSQSAKSALGLLKPEKQGVQYSRTHLRDYAIREMEATYRQQSSYIVNKDSFVPNGIFVKVIGEFDDFTRNAEFQATVSSIEELINSMYDNVNQKKSNDRVNENYSNDSDDEQNTPKWSAENIMKLLNMKPNKAEQMEGQILLKLMNSDRFITFDKNTLEQMSNKAKKMVAELRDGKDVKFTKLDNQMDVTMSFPLETGFPFTFTYRTPTLIQVEGRVQARTEKTENMENSNNNNKEDNNRIPDKVSVSADVNAVYSVLNEVTMSFANPSTRQRYSVGYDKKFQLNVPVRVTSEIDIRNREVKTEVKPLNDNKVTKVLQLGSWPYTTRDNVLSLRPLPESEHTKEIRGRPVRETKLSFGEKETGFAFTVRGTHEKDSKQLMNVVEHLRKHDMTSFFMFGLESTSPEYYTLNVNLDGKQSNSKSMKVSVNYSKGGKNNKYQPQSDDAKFHPRSIGQSADGSENLAIPTSTEPNSQQRREQFMRNAAEGMTAFSGADVLDIAVEFTGSKKRTYIGTVSGALSKTEGKSRILAFFQKSQSNEQSQEIYVQIDAKYKTAEELKDSNIDAGKPHAEIKFKLGYSLEKTLELATIRGDIKMKQSPEMKVRIDSEQTSAEHRNVIDHIDVELDLKKAPKEMLEREFSIKLSNVYSYLRYATIMYLNENFEYNGEKDKMSMEVRLSPDMEFVNVTLKTASMKSEWKGFPVPKMVKNAARVPINWNLVEEVKGVIIQNRDTCFIGNDKVNTFENRTLKNINLDDAWHLAVHKMRQSVRDENKNDAKAQTHYVSVMVRNVQQSEMKNKEVMIVLHQKNEKDITIRLSPSNQASNSVPRLDVNENEKDIAETMTEEVYSTGNNKRLLARVVVNKQDEKDGKKHDLKVDTELGDLEVIYNGEDVQIRSKSIFRNNHGICGAFTGQKTNELKTPDNKIVRNASEFIASWALIDGSNYNSELKKMQQHVRKIEYPKEEIEHGSLVQKDNKKKNNNNNQRRNGEDEESNNWEQRQEQNQDGNASMKFGTKHQTQYVEDKVKSRICFSKRPLPVCAPGTKANGKLTQKVEVICRNINDPAAQHYKSQIQSGRNLDLSNYRSHEQIKFTVPKRCEQN